VHDDAIRQELSAITNGELEFTNTPYVKHTPAPFRDETSAYGTPKRNRFKVKSNRSSHVQPPQSGNRMGGPGSTNTGGSGSKKKFKKRF
jgi:hypothetical protein